jgi:hypothetical protein
VPAREGQASVSPARLLRSPALGPADAAVRRTSGGGLPLPEPRHRLSARPRNGSVGSHRARPSRQQALVVRRQEQSGACPDRGSPLPEPRRSLRARSGEGGSVRATWFPLAAFPCGRPSKGSSVYILLGACSQRKRTYGLCTASIESAKDDTRSGTSEKPTGPSGSGSFSGPACPLGRNGTFGYREARAARGRQRATGVQASHDRYGLWFHPSRRLLPFGLDCPLGAPRLEKRVLWGSAHPRTGAEPFGRRHHRAELEAGGLRATTNSG